MELKERLAEMLTDRPQSRQVLATKLGVSDRRLRRLVQELRKEGVPVYSSSYEKGYRYGTDAEMQKYKAEVVHRIAELMKIVRALDRRQIPGQTEMETEHEDC